MALRCGPPGARAPSNSVSSDALLFDEEVEEDQSEDREEEEEEEEEDLARLSFNPK